MHGEGFPLVQHELLEVVHQVRKVLDVALEPAAQPVAPVVLPNDCLCVGGRRETRMSALVAVPNPTDRHDAPEEDAGNLSRPPTNAPA